MSSQWQAASQLFLYGRRHYTAFGFARHCPNGVGSALPEDLSGKTVFITGADVEAVSLEVAEHASGRGARVLLACSDQKRGQRIVDSLRAAAGTMQVELIVADCSTIVGVSQCAVALAELTETLHCAVLNTGLATVGPSSEELEPETLFRVHLACPFALAQYILPQLRATAEARVVLLTNEQLYSSSLFGPMHQSTKAWGLDRAGGGAW